MNYNHRRLQLEIPEELYARLQMLMPIGTRKSVFTKLAEQVCTMMEEAEESYSIIGGILDNKIRLEWDGSKRPK